MSAWGNSWGASWGNAWGSITGQTAKVVYGGFIPPRTLRKKDQEILEQVHALVAKLDEVPAPKKVKEQVARVEQKTKQIIFEDNTSQIKNLKAQITRLDKTINRLIKEAREDEEAAINALLSII